MPLLKKVFVILAVLMGLTTALTCVSSATTYVAVKFGDQIVVGADSCSTLIIDYSRHVPGPPACKIHKCADHTYFVYAGPVMNAATGIRFDELVSGACGKGGTTLQVVNRIRSRLLKAAQECYAKDGQPFVASTSLFGTNQRGSFLFTRAVKVDKDGPHEDPIDDCSEDCGNKYVAGGYHSVMDRLIKTPGFWDRYHLVGGVRELLTQEIKADKTNEIGFPLSILEVTSKGERWIEKGTCLRSDGNTFQSK